jgi:hypothetical protein
MRRFQLEGRVDRRFRLPGYQEANPTPPELLREFRFFAIIKTWMDEDIIEATVRNAQCQGAEAVYVVDNGSTDTTIERAQAAGAIVADCYESDLFEERLSQTLINAVVAHESLRCGAEHIWWMYLDADEFPEGPDGQSVREFLASLDKRFRIVGATFLNHLPDLKPEYVSGYHPIDFQPLCYKRVPEWDPSCGHWKHPLQRFDRHSSFIVCEGGAHHAVGGGWKPDRAEPFEGVIAHHFQYREEGFQRAKLELACGPSSRRLSWMRYMNLNDFDMRMQSLDAIYSQNYRDATDRLGIPLDPSQFFRWDARHTRRWYSQESVGAP